MTARLHYADGSMLAVSIAGEYERYVDDARRVLAYVGTEDGVRIYAEAKPQPAVAAMAAMEAHLL